MCARRVAGVALIFLIQQAEAASIDHQSLEWLTNSVISNVTALAGRNITLKERGAHFLDAIAWIKLTTRTILSASDELVTQSRRYSIEDKEGQTVDLKISNIRPLDEDTYICQVNTDPMMNYVIHMKVMVSPSFREAGRSKNNKVRVREGDPVTLECNAEGNPIPNITWRRQTPGGNDIVGSSNILHLRSVNQADGGNYLCIASNGYPPSVSKTFKIEVLFKPRITSLRVEKQTPYVYQIECRILSSPQPNAVAIKYKGRPISFKRIHSIHNTTLRLSANITASHRREKYVCLVSNTLGNASQATFVPGVRIPPEYFTTPAYRRPEFSSPKSSKTLYMDLGRENEIEMTTTAVSAPRRNERVSKSESSPSSAIPRSVSSSLCVLLCVLIACRLQTI